VIYAYILIQTDVGKSVNVSGAITDIAGVTRVNAVTGPYDVIAEVEAHTVDELGRIVLSKIQQVPNITRTVTCPIIHL
jgi:DNA-binding Lrp family transcriptional regulator